MSTRSCFWRLGFMCETRCTLLKSFESWPLSPEVFFANHHGPLAVNSGGQCGGFRTARNLLRRLFEAFATVQYAILLQCALHSTLCRVIHEKSEPGRRLSVQGHLAIKRTGLGLHPASRPSSHQVTLLSWQETSTPILLHTQFRTAAGSGGSECHCFRLAGPYQSFHNDFQ